MSWLKLAKPPAGPPEPAHVDHEALMTALGEARSKGVWGPAEQYLWDAAPSIQDNLDAWGEPVPLDELEQSDLDRLVAILAAPYPRGRALLHAGQLAPDEVDALVAVFPDIYAVLVTEATNDMLDAPPPYPDWSEEVLGVLFQQPPAEVYTGAQKEGDVMKGQPKGKIDTELPTQAERRDVAVRAAG